MSRQVNRPNLTEIDTSGKKKTPTPKQQIIHPITKWRIQQTSVPKQILPAPNIVPVRLPTFPYTKRIQARPPMTNPRPPMTNPRPPMTNPRPPMFPAVQVIDLTGPSDFPKNITPSPAPAMKQQKRKWEMGVKERSAPELRRPSPPPRSVEAKNVPQQSPVVVKAAKAKEPCEPKLFEKLLCENRVREFEKSEDALVKFWSNKWPWSEQRNIRVIHGFSNYKRECKYKYTISAIKSMIENAEWWVHLEVKDVPEGWKKEDVMNGILDYMPKLSFIPCFIDFGGQTCRFMISNCKNAFTKLHDDQFVVSVNGQKLCFNAADFKKPTHVLNVSQEVSNQLDRVYDDCKKSLNLSHFLLASDISYIFYFPLAHPSNQYTLVNIKSHIPWHTLLHLDLSNNNLQNIDNFGLDKKMPRLQTLNLSNNKLDTVLRVACCKGMKVRQVWLEGNPLCYDYIDQTDYIEVAKTIFPNLAELDGVSIDWSGTPMMRDNYLVDLDAHNVAEKFLEVYFALIESSDKASVQNLYTDDAMLSVTCGFLGKLQFRRYLMLFQSRSRDIRKLVDRSDYLYIGAEDIASLIGQWPQLKHDPLSFYVDVHFHSTTATILTVSGILKIPSATFKDEEPVLEFTRTFILKCFDNYEHKITNDMMHLTLATGARAESAFEKILLADVDQGLKFETAPSDYMKEKLTAILVKLIQLPKNEAQKCLEMRNWHLKQAIEYFIILQNRNELYLLSHYI